MRVWRIGRGKDIPECLCMVNNNRNVSVMVVGIGYHGDGNLIILDENLNVQNYVKTLSENFLDSTQNMFGDRNHPCVFQHDSAPAHTTVELSHGWSSRKYPPCNGHPSPRPSILKNKFEILRAEIVRVMPVTRNDLIRALHNPWMSITVPYLHNLNTPLPRRVRAVTRGRGYPTKY